LSDVQGTGRDGRILKEDMLRYLESRQRSKTDAAPVAFAKPQVSIQSDMKTSQMQTSQQKGQSCAKASTLESPVGVDRVEPIRGFKKAMVKSMNAALVHLCSLQDLRQIYAISYENYSLKLH